MNRERFDDLRAQAQAAIERKAARAAELQENIATASQLVAANAVRRDEAQAAGDAAAYQDARNLADMHTERMHKAQDELRSLNMGAALSKDLYDAIKAFIEQESEASAVSCIREIKARIDDIMRLVDAATAYYTEMRDFAAQCEHVNGASYSGQYRLISAGHIPGPLVGELQNLQAHFTTMAK